jgi:DNA primase
LLFGARELEQTDTVLLVEGALDVVAVREAGFDALGTYGSRLHDQQIRALRRLGVYRVLVAYDMDRAGSIGAAEAIGALYSAGITAAHITWDDQFKDLGEMDRESRRKFLETLDMGRIDT